MILDYNQLVTDYWENLNSQLRGFNAGVDFLDTWVPDEDPVRSIQSLCESATLHGENSIELKISAKMVTQVGRSEFEQSLKEFGKIEISDEGDSMLVRVQFNG